MVTFLPYRIFCINLLLVSNSPAILNEVIDAIVKATEFNNGEKNVQLYSVRVHETTTGYAESFREDLVWCDFELEDIKISDGIKSEFKDEKMFEKLIKAGKTKSKCFKNDIVEQQV